jgi:hypothetical protein
VNRRKEIKKEKKAMLSMKNINPFAMMKKLGGMVGNIISDEPEEEEEDDDDSN